MNIVDKILLEFKYRADRQSEQVDYLFKSLNSILKNKPMFSLEMNNFDVENEQYEDSINCYIDPSKGEVTSFDLTFIINRVKGAYWHATDMYLNGSWQAFDAEKISKALPLKQKMTITFWPLYNRGHQQVHDEPHTDNYYYHITPIENLASIKKKGLIPLSGNKKSTLPPRVYVSLNAGFGMLGTLRPAEKQNISGKYVELKINKKKLPSDIKFYQDPEDYDALYTYSKIPPSALEIGRTSE